MEFKPLSGREFPRFSAIKTFFRLPQVSIKANFDIALFGIPYDGGVSYRPGARFAPSQVREASSLGRGFHFSRDKNFFKRLKYIIMKSMLYGGATLMIGASIYGFVDYKQTHGKKEFREMYAEETKRTPVAVPAKEEIQVTETTPPETREKAVITI